MNKLTIYLAISAIPFISCADEEHAPDKQHFHFDATIVQQNCFMDARTEHDCQRCYGDKLYACMALLSPQDYQQQLDAMQPQAYRSYMQNMSFVAFCLHATRCAATKPHLQQLITDIYRAFYEHTIPKKEQRPQTLAGYKEHFLTYQADMKGKQIWIEQQFRCIRTSDAYMQLIS